jgi:hypothetical protein
VLPNARDHRPAEAGEARCSGSGASTGWAAPRRYLANSESDYEIPSTLTSRAELQASRIAFSP